MDVLSAIIDVLSAGETAVKNLWSSGSVGVGIRRLLLLVYNQLVGEASI